MKCINSPWDQYPGDCKWIHQLPWYQCSELQHGADSASYVDRHYRNPVVYQIVFRWSVTLKIQYTRQSRFSKTRYLNDHRFSTHSRGCSNQGHVRCFVTKVFQSVENTSTGSRDTTVNTTLVNWFASNASVTVDVIVADGRGISISNPSHFAFACSHVRCWDVNTRACQSSIKL